MTKTSYVVMAVGENCFIKNIIANSITASFNVWFINLTKKRKMKEKKNKNRKIVMNIVLFRNGFGLMIKLIFL